MQQKHSKLLRRKLIRNKPTKHQRTLCQNLSTRQANKTKLARNLNKTRELQDICNTRLLVKNENAQKQLKARFTYLKNQPRDRSLSDLVKLSYV